MKKIIICSFILWSCIGFASRPKLVVMIVIDQFRADYLTRFENKFSQKGFKYLMSHGAYFPFGEYDILQSMTGPGHATVLTGAYPYQMGIPVNDWYDQKTHSAMYCVEDKELSRSPKNLIGTTVGDELKNAGYDGKVVSLALKDRAAILMGGHRADLAFWMEGNQWVSSQYYMKNGGAPDWMASLNSALKKAPCDIKSPCGISTTTEAFKTVLEKMKLGRSKNTDLIAVSFSSHDYAGHIHGPNSQEMEDMTLAEDKAMEQMISAINSYVPGGMRNTVLVLTGDHGISFKPADLVKAGIESGRIEADDVVKNLEKKLAKSFGKPKGGHWITHVTDFNFYFDEAAIQEAGVDQKKMEDEVKQELLKLGAFAYVITSHDYKSRDLPPLMFERQILKTYYPGRSGQVIGIVKPFFTDAGHNNVTHMTGYAYDRTVPIIFIGSGIKRGVFADKAEVVDIAPTLSFLVGTIPPALCEGHVLKEILQ